MTQEPDTSFKIPRRVALAALAGGIGALALPSLGFAASTASSATPGAVYVIGNPHGPNVIFGFARAADGTLTPLAGSPFPTGGQGVGVPVDAQGGLQRSADGKFLLAVNPGSNQLSVESIGTGGVLAAVAGSPFPSNGSLPASIAVNGSLVYVANQNPDGTNYTGFQQASDGSLRPLAGSTFALPPGSQPADILFDASGQHAIGTRLGTWLIDSFLVGANGLLTPAAGSPFPSQGPGPFGAEFRPQFPHQLAVSNAHGPANEGTVSVFQVTSGGALQSVAGSPFPDYQTAPCWVEFTHDGKYLFVSNTGSNTISRFSVASSGALTLLGNVTPRGVPPAGVFDLRLDPSGSFLYVVETLANAIGIFAVTNGSLAELPSSPVSLATESAPSNAAAPFGLVAT